MSPTTLEHQHRKACRYYLNEFLLGTTVHMIINQPCKQSVTHGKDCKTNCRTLNFPLVIHLLRKKRMKKLAKENIQVFTSGTVQICLCLSLFIPITDSARGRSTCRECSEGHVSPFWSLGIVDDGLWVGFPTQKCKENYSRASKQTEWVYLQKNISCVIEDCSVNNL